MTCRVARSFHNSVTMDLVSCCECGSTHLEVFLASKTLGPHLCSICAQSLAECGAEAPMAQAPTSGGFRDGSGVFQKHELQSSGRT